LYLGSREPHAKFLSHSRGLKAFGIPEKGEGVSVALIASLGIGGRIGTSSAALNTSHYTLPRMTLVR